MTASTTSLPKRPSSNKMNSAAAQNNYVKTNSNPSVPQAVLANKQIPMRNIRLRKPSGHQSMQLPEDQAEVVKT